MKKSLSFWLYFSAVVMTATYFSVRIIMTSMGMGSASVIKSISVISDSNNSDLSVIAAGSGITAGTKTYSVNLNDIRDRISMMPDVKKVAVRRLPNGDIIIKLNLHKAIAFWTDDKFIYPVSKDGTIINKPIEERLEGTILFRGKMPADITEITKFTRQISADLNYIEFIENRRFNLFTNQNITVMLPEENASSAINNLILLQKNYKILSRDIKVLDMRDANKIIVK